TSSCSAGRTSPARRRCAPPARCGGRHNRCACIPPGRPMARPRCNRVTQVLLTALACGANVENAARKAGVSERTVYRRLRQAAFQKQLDELSADMVQRTAGMLTGAGMNSVKTLVDLQQDGTVAPAV